MEEIMTILLGAAPISEIRGAIPVAVGLFQFSPLKAYLLGLLGNLIFVAPFYLFLKYGVRAARNYSRRADKFFGRIFERTRRLHSERFETWGALGLFTFVAIPFPITGAWTGTVAAFLFGIPLWKSLIAILLGVIVSGIIVLMATLGLINFVFI